MNIAEQTLIVKVELTALGERIKSRNTDGTHDETFRTVVEAIELINHLQESNAKLLTNNSDLQHKWAESQLKIRNLTAINENLKAGL